MYEVCEMSEQEFLYTTQQVNIVISPGHLGVICVE